MEGSSPSTGAIGAAGNSGGAALAALVLTLVLMRLSGIPAFYRPRAAAADPASGNMAGRGRFIFR